MAHQGNEAGTALGQGGMAERRGSREPSSQENGLWAPLDEGYWRALLEQGEYPTQGLPPSDPLEREGRTARDEPTGRPFADAQESSSGRAPNEDVWKTAEEASARGDRFQLVVCGANRGGLLVEWHGLQGFVPASHLLKTPEEAGPRERLAELLGRVGDMLTLRVIEVNRSRGRLVLSERQAESSRASREDVIRKLSVGEIRQGKVTGLTSFGAFVDLGGVEGLVHVSELAWSRVRHPSDVLHAGKKVEVQILGIHPDQGRIALSLKRTRPNPWSQVETRYRVGQVVEGKVTTVTDFGAFVSLEDGLEGLVHSSELGGESYLHPRSVVTSGDTVWVRILNIDAHNHRMGLSMRQVAGQASLE